MPKTIGVSGNAPLINTMQTGEYLRKLDGYIGRKVFDEMRRSDPMIRAIRDAVNLPITCANWAVNPPKGSAGKKIAEAVERNMLKGMSVPWRQFMRETMLMCDFGFSPFEKVYERVDTLIALRKLDTRLPQSVTGWKYDEGQRRLISMVQTDSTTFKDIEIPIEKLVVFTNRREGDNWEGISDLRPAYGSWWMKNILLKINAIKHDRHGVGTPVAEAPEGVNNESDAWKAMEETLESIYAQEKSYIVVPNGWKITLLSAAGQNAGTDVLPSIRYLDERISVAVLSQFLNLGTTQTGSRALGDSFIDFFLLSLQERAEYIADILNRFVVRELVNLNYGEMDEYPEITPSRIEPLAFDAIQKLKTAGVITADIGLENTVRQALGIAEIEEPEREANKPAPPVTQVVGPDKEQVPEEQKPEEPKVDDASDQKPKAKATHQHAPYARELRPEEQIVDWPHVVAQLDTSVDKATAEVLAIRRTQIDKIALSLAGGRRVKDIGVPGTGDQYDLLVKTYKAMKQAGAADMRQEILRQVPTAKANANPCAAEPLTEEEYDDLMAEDISLAVEGAANKLKATMAAIYLDLRKEGMSGEQIRSVLPGMTEERLGDRTWEDMGHLATNEGYGRGRDDAARDFEDQIERSYRSGVLDQGICPVCMSKDGQEHDWGDPEFMAPDPECEGGPRCRCLNIAVMKRESEA